MEALQILSRKEMKMIKGGDGWESCSCYNIQGESQGSVTCSEDIDKNQCCQLQYSGTFAVNCSPTEPMEA